MDDNNHRTCLNFGSYSDESEEILVDKLSTREQKAVIFHLLYALESYNNDISLEAVSENISRGFNIKIKKESLVFNSFENIKNQQSFIDEKISLLLSNWRLERLGLVTKIILRIGIWEILNSNYEPALVINDCIELAKCYAEKDAYKFINGILDKFAKSLESKPTS